jgi:hypothetical protein
MLLSLMRVEGVEPEQLMRRSYRQYQAECELPALERRVAQLKASRETLSFLDDSFLRLCLSSVCVLVCWGMHFGLLALLSCRAAHRRAQRALASCDPL